MIDLRKLKAEHPECFENENAFRAYLRDLYPLEKAKINVLSIMFSKGIDETIKSGDSLSVCAFCDGIQNEYGFSQKIVEECFTLFANLYNGIDATSTHNQENRIERNLKLCSNDDFEFEGTILKKYKHLGYSGEVVVPDGVTAIGDKAFERCTNLTGIVMPQSIEFIGEAAFGGCSSLVSIIIPNAVVTIGHGAFFSCVNLTHITIPDSVAAIGGRAFLGCNKLQFVSYDNALYLGNDNNPYAVLVQCINKDIIDCKIHKKTQIILRSAFEDAEKLTNVSVDSGNFKFYSIQNCIIDSTSKTLVIGCKNSIIPKDKSVIAVGDYAFYKKKKLTKIDIPFGIVSIGAYAFSECINLRSVEIPNSVTEIGDAAFCRCLHLIRMEIPSGVKKIGGIAFDGCKSLAVVRILNGLKSIGPNAFNGCNALMAIMLPTSIKTIGWGAFRDCRSLTEIVLPDGMKRIHDITFSGCKQLVNIDIPDSVSSISEYAFSECKALKKIIIHKSCKVHPNAFPAGCKIVIK